MILQALPFAEAAPVIDLILKVGPAAAVPILVLWLLAERKERRDLQQWLQTYLEKDLRAKVALRLALYRRGIIPAEKIIDEPHIETEGC